MFFLRKNIRFVYMLESPRRGDFNKYTKRMIHKKFVQKYPLFLLLRVHIKFLHNSKFDFNSKIFGNKQCRYNEGPLYCIKMIKVPRED